MFKKGRLKQAKKTRILLVFGGLIFICLIGLCFIGYQYLTSPQKNISLKPRADAIIEYCTKNSAVREQCYANEIIKYLGPYSIEQVTDLIKQVQAKDHYLVSCHALGHRLGEKLLAMNNNDWLAAFRQCPDHICSYGCGHGAIQPFFRDVAIKEMDHPEVVAKQLADVCKPSDEWNKTDNGVRNCLHSMGHVAFYMYDGDLAKSISFCNMVASYGNRPELEYYMCSGGIFMQAFLPDAQDAQQIQGQSPPTRENLSEFCSQFDLKTQPICIMEGWPLFVEDVQTSKGLSTFCKRFIPYHQELDCIHRLAAEVVLVQRMDPAKAEELCRELPEDEFTTCISGAATQLFSVDASLIPQAVEVCNRVEEAKPQFLCFDKIMEVGSVMFGVGSPSYEQLCSLLPVSIQDECRTYH